MATSTIKNLNTIHITESGTTDGWTYKKYSDGTYEAFKFRQFTNVYMANKSGIEYYTGDLEFSSLPSFNDTLTAVTGNTTGVTVSQSNGVRLYSAWHDSTNNCIRVVFRSTNSATSASCPVTIYIQGTWK